VLDTTYLDQNKPYRFLSNFRAGGARQRPQQTGDSMSTALLFAVFGLGGIASGFFAGLFGIGGGLIMVPILVYAFKTTGMVSDHVLAMALGTSMAAIVFSSAQSAYGHYYKGSASLEKIRLAAPWVVAGVLIGGSIAVRIPARSARKNWTTSSRPWSAGFCTTCAAPRGHLSQAAIPTSDEYLDARRTRRLHMVLTLGEPHRLILVLGDMADKKPKLRRIFPISRWGRCGRHSPLSLEFRCSK